MLRILESLPAGLLERDTSALHEVLDGPALIHLPGALAEPLFVAVLLHGDENTGWLAVRKLLRGPAGCGALPRALSLYIGNVRAARTSERFLDGQPDFNRIWKDTPANAHLPERAHARRVVAEMERRGVFACIDVHNNSGRNPHYACVSRLDPRFIGLARRFSRRVLYFRIPETVLTEAFSGLCPSVTLECGRPGDDYGVAHVREYLAGCLRLRELPCAACDDAGTELFRLVAAIKVRGSCAFGPGAAADVEFIPGLDAFNFRALPAGTLLGWVRRPGRGGLDVRDEAGRDVGRELLRIEGGEIRTAVPLMPSMFTTSVQAVAQDCLGYLMAPLRFPDSDGRGASAQ